MFLVSRKFHDDFGVPGTEVTGTKEEKVQQQATGWEWWPSIFWQMFWAWVFAPYILWQSRHVHDTHGWRFQTMACCLAGYVHPRPSFIPTSLTVKQPPRESDVAHRSLRSRNEAGEQVLRPAHVDRSFDYFP